MSEREPVLAFEGVSYRYPGAAAPALDDVTLSIGEGELCLVAGLTGQGKSTLLRAACALVPHFHGGCFAGRVSVAGMDTREHGAAQLGAFAGVLFQDPETQLVMSSVRAELALALEARGHGAAAVARGVEETALALGIDHLLDRPTAELSGGEKQRVALGAALAGRPRLVLLDEPTSQLDPVAGDELIALLRRLNHDWELTVLIAEHRLERCLADVDRVIVMAAGRVVHDGDPHSFVRYAGVRAPALQPPGARMFSLAGLPGAPVGVREARAELRAHGLLAGMAAAGAPAGAAAGVVAGADAGAVAGAAGAAASSDTRSAAATREARRTALLHAGRRLALAERRTRRRAVPARALEMRGVWHELDRGPAILRGVDLKLHARERVALMGRNGAGKSTLLRHAAGLLEPTRGSVERSGRVALLLQNPGDYFLHERVCQEASADALAAAGLAALARRNPRDLSGGERQRLALAILTDAGEQGEEPAVLALDEPTRGMDRDAKAGLAAELRRRAGEGQAVIVATHDAELAAAYAERVLLMADGRIIADGPAAELLSGGWYFATEIARILAGTASALLPEQGATLLTRRSRARRAEEAALR